MTDGALGAGKDDLRRDDERAGDDAERLLGRAVSVGLPLVALSGAVAAGLAGGIGSALLVLAACALLGGIALLWASLRTLSGDAPLPEEMDRASFGRELESDILARKRRVLLALKDIERERALGKMDDADYEEISRRYRDEAKHLMRDIDRQIAPARAKAERLAEEFLARRKKGPAAGADERRLGCRTCGTSNESDAAFCKRCGAPVSANPGTKDASA